MKIFRPILQIYKKIMMAFSREQGNAVPVIAKQIAAINRRKPDYSGYFGTPEGIRTPDTRLRRAVLCPAELLARIQFLFVSVTPAVENPPNVRRRSLYTTELQGHMQNYSIVQFRWTRDRRMLGGVCYIHLTKEACRCIVAQVFHTVKRALPRQEPGKGLDFYRSSRK